jgi:hypothetical protein
MGIDRDLAKGFGFLVLGVVIIGSVSLALVGVLTGNTVIIETLAPLVVLYSAILAVTAIGIAGYAFLSSRRPGG